MEITIEVQSNGAVVLPPALREQYQIHAGDRLRLVDVDGVFILAQQKHSAPSLREQRNKEFEAEIAHFERLKPQLLQQHAGRFVAIYHGEVVAVGDDKMDVLATVQAAHGDVSCYITQVTENGLRRVRMLSPRIVRS
jgi:bifunctional DNA-binding transcriptional regulator/antitoxin component of YhaV-PrlF toxin-antitoxin module